MKASEYNLFSSTMSRRLKPNERATYRILNVKPDPDNYNKFIIPAALQIPSTDIIWDESKKDFVTIACIQRTKNDGDPIFESIIFEGRNMGYVFLNGNNPADQRMFQFMELCNYNLSNESRNQEVEPLFQRIDTKKDAINERAMRKLIVKAVNKALDLDDQTAKEVASALGIDASSIEEIRNSLEDYAGDCPEDFLEVLERASISTEASLKEAIKQGYIKNNTAASQFEWSETGKEIFKYKKAAGKNYVRELAEYLEENNPDEIQSIKTRLGEIR
jgi:hypothetical protein